MATRPTTRRPVPLRRRPRVVGRRRGYILVVTLAVLVLAAGLMVGLGRAAVRHAVRAREARDDLQRRWGTASCRQAVLPVAERVLAAEERRTGGPVPSLATVVRLGGQRFELTVADEQAKADVNALLAATVDRSAAEARVRQAIGGYGLADRVRLRPDLRPPPAVARVSPSPARPSPDHSAAARPATGPAPPGPLITGLGQVLDAVPPELWRRSPVGGGPPPIDLLTCWGGGAVNVRRASGPALRLAVSPPFTGIEIGRLLEARDEMFFGRRSATARPAAGIGSAPRDAARNRSPVRRLVDAAGLSASGGRLAPRLTDGSTCHSLWVVADDGRRRAHALAVLDTSDRERPTWTAFAW